MRIFFGKKSILKAISTFVEKIEFAGVKTIQLNIFPGGKKNSAKIGQIFSGQARWAKMRTGKFGQK